MNKTTRKIHKPKIDEHEDALGELGGQNFSAFAKQAKLFATLQAVDAVGRRPEDWIKRDLLVSSSGDDRRNWMFKKLLKNESTFLNQHYDSTQDLLEDRVVRSSRAFDYLHRRYVGEMLERMDHDSAEYKVLASALVCPTALYQTNDLIPHRLPFVRNRNVCKNAWNCPHCYSRAVVQEFERYKSGILNSNAYGLALISDSENVSTGDVNQCNIYCQGLRQKVYGLARSMGATGGMLSLQAAPNRHQQVLWDVNEAYCQDSDVLQIRVALLAVIPKKRDSLTKYLQFKESQATNPELAGEHLQIDTVFEICKDVVRMMLVAKSEQSESWYKLENNDYGLFYWPPVWLCSVNQWVGRYRMTKGKKSFQPWGDWPNC